MLQNVLRGYEGPVYPVNPNYADIEGLKCYPTVEAIPGEVELAVILVAAAGVPQVLGGCARKGIKRVMIQSAGFAEVGPEGRALAKGHGKALLFWVLGLPEPVRSFQKRGLALGIPVFRELSTAMEALGAVRDFWRRKASVQRGLQRIAAS